MTTPQTTSRDAATGSRDIKSHETTSFAAPRATNGPPTPPPQTASRDPATGSRDIKSHETTSFADLGKEMWAYLTGKGAAINYALVDIIVEEPRETGARGAV